MDRRDFLRAAVVATGGAVTVPLVGSAVGAQPGPGPYGSLDGIEPDDNGIILPPGFTSRIVAIAGEPVGNSDYRWLVYPDGAAVFEDGEGGWVPHGQQRGVPSGVCRGFGHPLRP